jgi:NAD(P)-dependent dehydrogenase (short-subunit alcohol dehydrogenase family)
MKADLRGAVIAVTGGARGIGLAIARALAAKGARVAIGDLDAGLASEAARSFGGHAAALDVRDRASFQAFLSSTCAALGPLDVLINNAGIMPMGAFLDESDAVSDAQIDVNLRGVILGMKLALPEMLARGRGHIVNVASLAGRVPIPGAAVYCGTKFAVVGLTETVREELRGRGISFSTVLPSRVSTELAAGTAAGSGVPTASPEEVAEAVIDALIHHLPEVTVPRYLAPVPALYGAAPAWLLRGFRRLVRDHRILTHLDRGARATIEERIDALARSGR